MRLLLDTHVVVWATHRSARLGVGRQLVLDADQRLLSAVCVWELAIEQGLGKLTLGSDVRTWTRRAAAELALDHLPVTAEHAAAVEHLPDVHRDPFDRLLVAQAVAEGAVLLPADTRLAGYGDAVRVVG
ncbi:PIN domain nuclease, a component of toxin-antitoxin system (PIN domain) [Geodermatophilus saharensis]|uniref:PIN domain nuclease, a component of toxin-antitoxin system (PIN domain) n=1 Tax=Geodermatophilus saharensis TaxID=1137994 RepID=A0A239HWB2_9ACTN|nr:type II toxin-antitoxin system VapC family toxin [Geodermatophilus saharensis]SNS85670.1 PIN domain nuclease, a component of toxin-antitoxin system (PIN domain) [Geodermatophilus saharensis]